MFCSYQQNSNSLIFVIILLSTLSYCSLLARAQTVPLIIEELQTCQSNQDNIVIFKFNLSTNIIDYPKLDDNSREYFEIVNHPSESYEKGIKLIKALNASQLIGDKFSLDIDLDSNTKIRINGIFSQACEDSYKNSCTVIIAFLASLCLILFTALALALIILRRKKPVTFKFGQQSERDNNDRMRFNGNNDYEENSNELRKQSNIEVSNGILSINKSVPTISETTPTYPRKSSLKPPKNGSFSEQIINNNYKKSTAKANTKANSSHDNAAYIGTDLDKVEEEIEDKPAEEPQEFQETRRKSIVTFSEKPEVKYH